MTTTVKIQNDGPQKVSVVQKYKDGTDYGGVPEVIDVGKSAQFTVHYAVDLVIEEVKNEPEKTNA